MPELTSPPALTLYMPNEDAMVAFGGRLAAVTQGLGTILIIILSREILVSGLREYLATTKVGLPVTRLAKWKTGFQMTAIGFLLAGDSTASLLDITWLPVNLLGAIMLWVAAALTLVTGWDYLSTGIQHVTRNNQSVGNIVP